MATNRSAVKAQRINVLIDYMPGAVVVSANGAARGCARARMLICQVGPLVGGASTTIAVVLRPVALGKIDVRAEVAVYDAADTNDLNDRVASTVEVAPPPPPACPPALWPGLTAGFLSEGEVAEDSFGHPSTGAARALMVFVDFADARASESTEAVYDLLVPEAAREFAEQSYGRFALEVTALHQWVRLPGRASSYGGTAAIKPSVAAVDNQVDFRRFSFLYVVTPRSFPIATSPAYVVPPGAGVTADGVEIRHGAVFGSGARPSTAGDQTPAHILLHETGHTLGLPDLYEIDGLPWPQHLRFAGSWDPMSSLWPTTHFLAWHKWKLGWLDVGQLRCLSEPAVVEETLSPLATPGGMKAIVVLTGPSTAFVVEARRRIGQDSALCEEGVLVYSVDATVATGDGPIQVRAAQADNQGRISECGAIHEAPFDVGPDEVAHFEDVGAGVVVDVLESLPEGYRVRVTKR